MKYLFTLMVLVSSGVQAYVEKQGPSPETVVECPKQVLLHSKFYVKLITPYGMAYIAETKPFYICLDRMQNFPQPKRSEKK